jgi:hypothetical protein
MVAVTRVYFDGMQMRVVRKQDRLPRKEPMRKEDRGGSKL